MKVGNVVRGRATLGGGTLHKQWRSTLVRSSSPTREFVHSAICPLLLVCFVVGASPALPQEGASSGFVVLDQVGERGWVRFDHVVHEGIEDATCQSCHHTVEVASELEQFQSCSSCHKNEGHHDNPVDDQGYDLNAREVFHRNCVECHRSSKVTASNERVQNASFTRCAECHDSRSQAPVFDVTTFLRSSDTTRITDDERAAETVATQKPPRHEPAGFALASRIPIPESPSNDDRTPAHFEPRPDRWRIGLPEDARLTSQGKWWDPYHQNALKGDFPISGQDLFLNLTASSDTLATGADASSGPSQTESRQRFVVGAELFKGSRAYQPARFRVQMRALVDAERLDASGTTRDRSHTDVSLQRLFGELRLGDTPALLPGGEDDSPYYDSTSLRVGIQPFISDFRGLVFRDDNLGVRLFGNLGGNLYQFNAAYFRILDSDPESRLNELDPKDHDLLVLNVYRRDTLVEGYTSQFSLHLSDDSQLDQRRVRSTYLGWAGSGHLGRLDLSHALYQVWGSDTIHPLAGQRIDIDALLLSVELAWDRDWLRFEGGFLWASGDSDPSDGDGNGFDSILDFPSVAGGPFSQWNRGQVQIPGTGLALVQRNSVLPNLRTSKRLDSSNFVNPGLFLTSLGVRAFVTPKIDALVFGNLLRFEEAAPLEQLLADSLPEEPRPAIGRDVVVGRDIGIELGAGIVYRPLLSENVALWGGFSTLLAGDGLDDLWQVGCSAQLLDADCDGKSDFSSAFVRLVLTY